MTLPPVIIELATAVAKAGGRALLVGGGVRDELLDIEPKDFDIEVFGLALDRLIPLLRRIGRVDEVGRSFGVLKLTPRGGEELDVSIPRRDSNAGPGHRGIAVEGDPDMSLAEAATRRDLTVNAISKDPLTGEIVDPHGGLADLEARRLRAVDADTFLEDPLRALRAVQFAARLRFDPDPSLVDLCRRAPLDELPAERVLGEWHKLLVKGREPSRGLRLARESQILERVFPTLIDDPNLDRALDRLAAWPHRAKSTGWQLAAGLLVWTERTEDPNGVLDVFSLQRSRGYAVRKELLRARACREWPTSSPADIRRLSASSEVRLGLALRHALGANTDNALATATALGVLEQAPTRLVTGAALKALGVSPGPDMGRLLATLYERQLDGAIATLDEGLAAAKQLLAD